MCRNYFNQIPRWVKRGASCFAIPLAIVHGSPVSANTYINQRYESGSLGVQTQTGTNCTSRGADRGAIGVFATGGTGGGGSSYDSFGSYSTSSARAGIGISIPFGGPKIGNCSKLLEMEEGRNRLQLAMELFEAGGISAEELAEIAADVANSAALSNPLDLLVEGAIIIE